MDRPDSRINRNTRIVTFNESCAHHKCLREQNLKLEFMGYPDIETLEFRFSEIGTFRRRNIFQNIFLIDPFQLKFQIISTLGVNFSKNYENLFRNKNENTTSMDTSFQMVCNRHFIQNKTAWKIEKLGSFVLERPIISWKVLIEVGQLCRLKVFIVTFLAFF